MTQDEIMSYMHNETGTGIISSRLIEVGEYNGGIHGVVGPFGSVIHITPEF